MAKQILKVFKICNFIPVLCTSSLQLKMNDVKIVRFATCFSSTDWFQPKPYVGQTSIHNLKKSAEMAGLL